MENLAEEINKAWAKLYGGEPATDPKALIKRIQSIVDDVLCGRANFKATNEALVKMDKELRGPKSNFCPNCVCSKCDQFRGR